MTKPKQQQAKPVEKKYHHPTTKEAMCRWAAGQIKRRKWVYWGLFGEPGDWKSSTALQLAKEVQEITRPGHPFDPQRQVVRNSSEYAVARRTLPAGSVIVRDEAMKSGGNKMRFMSNDNNQTVEDVNTGRKLYHVVIECNPFADDLDPRLFKHLHHTWRFTGEGVGTVFECRKLGFKKIRVWEEGLFNFRLRHCAEVYPELWDAYMGAAVDEVRGLKADLLEREERLANHQAAARRILG